MMHRHTKLLVVLCIFIGHARTSRAADCAKAENTRSFEDFKILPREKTVRDSMTFTGHKAGDRARADLMLTSRKPFTLSSLTLTLSNIAELKLRIIYKAGKTKKSKALIFKNPGENVNLPATGLPETVVRLVILADPPSLDTTARFGLKSLQACLYEASSAILSPSTTTKNAAASNTQAPTPVIPDLPIAGPPPAGPMSACGVSQELDRLSGVTGGVSRRRRVAGGASTGHCDVIPWQVRLTSAGGKECGGSILDARHILTAASCIPDSGFLNLTAGDYNVKKQEGNEQRRNIAVSDVLKHPKYYTNVYGAELNDVAVVKLSEPLDMTKPCVQPVCLDRDFVMSAGNCTVSGWGPNSDTLQHAKVLAHRGPDCAQTFKIPFSVYLSQPQSQFCAGRLEGGVGSCMEDAGGPLVCRDNSRNAYIQVGIMSYTFRPCGLKNYPAIYADIRAFYSWIIENAEIKLSTASESTAVFSSAETTAPPPPLPVSPSIAGPPPAATITDAPEQLTEGATTDVSLKEDATASISERNTTEAPTLPTTGPTIAAPPVAVVTTIAAPPAATTTSSPGSNCGVSTVLDDLALNSTAVGGASIGQCDVIPWQVRLTKSDQTECEGAILDASHILTAAHCIPDTGAINVTAGTYQRGTEGQTEQIQTVSVSNITLHPNYYTTVYGSEMNDVAVVRLSEPLDMTDPCVQPVCLDKDFVASAVNCTVSGWGQNIRSSTLQVARVFVHKGEDCITAFNVPYAVYISQPDFQLCAALSSKGDAECLGGPGAPLVCRDDSINAYVLAGIKSYGDGCGSPGFPAIFAEVGAFHDWIQQQLN